ncbi:hypothetical protein BTHI11S_00283 [Bosea thiooxidans]
MINELGGLKSLGGAKVELLVTDIQSKPEGSRAEAERLISRERVSALTGAWASATTIPAAQIADRNRTPFMITSAVNDALTEQGMKYVFRTAVKAKWFGGYIADFLDYQKSKGISVGKIALATEDGPAGQAVRSNYTSVMPGRGYPILTDETFRTGTPDFSTIATKLRTSGADGLLTCAYAEDFDRAAAGAGRAGFPPPLCRLRRRACEPDGPRRRQAQRPDLRRRLMVSRPEQAGEPGLREGLRGSASGRDRRSATMPPRLRRDLCAGAGCRRGHVDRSQRDPRGADHAEDHGWPRRGAAGPRALLRRAVQSPATCVIVQAIEGKFVTVRPEAVAARPPAPVQG